MPIIPVFMPSRERLHELLSYNADTGILTWKVKRGSKSAGSVAGGLGSEGYITVFIDGHLYKAHRVALHMTGIDVDGLLVDHINGIKTDNRAENLRVVSQHGNARNIRKPTSRSISGILGIGRRPSGRWRAQLSINNKNYWIGTFDTKEEALAAYLEAKRGIRKMLWVDA